MASCRICDSPLPEGAKACVACGTPVGRKTISGATIEQFEKAQAAAHESVGLEGAKGTDAAVANRLLQKADKARSENDLDTAIESAKAAKRAVEIAGSKARIQARLSEAKLTVERAKAAGVETLALEKSLIDATKAIDAGDLGGAERLLRRTGARKQEAQLHKRAESLLEAAKKKVTYCRERGADPSEAMDELKKAEEALKADDFAEVRNRCLKAQETAEQARRFARAESFLKVAMAETGEAGKEGADVTVARRLIHEARENLKNGVYADVQRLSREIRATVKVAKRHAAAEGLLKRVENEAKKEERRKSDVSAAYAILEHARKALAEGEYARVRGLARDASIGVKEAAELRKMLESLDSLKLDVADLRAIKADTSEVEILLKDAAASFEAKKPDDVRKLITRARKAVELAREAVQRAAVATAVEKIVEKAGAGRLDASKVKALLRQVEDAALVGQAFNIERMVEQELELPNQERLRRAILRLERIRDLLVELRRTDVDVAGADELIAKAREQLDHGHFDDAETIMGQLEDLTQSLKTSLEGSARDLIDRSREAVASTESKGVTSAEARKFLESAEESFKRGKIYEALEFARLAHLRAERALETKEKKSAVEEAETLRIVSERTRGMQRKLWELQQRVDELAKVDVDVAKPREGLASVHAALDKNEVEEAEIRLKATEDAVGLLWADLKSSSERQLETAKTAIKTALEEGVHLPPLDDMLARGEQALNESRFSEAFLVAASIEQAIAASRGAQEKERGKQVAEEGKRATKTFARVKALIAELKSANVDIEESDEVIAKAETALREREFEDVEGILQELETTASELKAQLLVAAKAIIERGTERLKRATEYGIPTGEAAEILDTAKESLQTGKIDRAIEYGSIAENKADEAIKVWETQQEAFRTKEQDLAKAEIANFKKLIADLSRADIEIMGSGDAVEKAERAFGEGRFADVAKELLDSESLAQTLQEGLRQAAVDLLDKSKSNLESAKTAGLEIFRGEKVLSNADEALKDGRYVETIEYTKVINDIVETAKRHADIRQLESELKALSVEVDRTQALGIDVTKSNELLKKAQEDLALGRFENLQEIAKKISDMVGLAQQVHVAAKLKAMNAVIQDCRDAGLETGAAEALYTKAEEAVQKKDLTALDDIAKQVEVLLDGARRAAEGDRVEKDIRTFEDMLAQAARVGVEVGDLRPMALQAREGLKALDLVKAESLVAEGKTMVRERRRRQFSDRYESKMRGISTMIDSARKFGVNVVEAERILAEASKALEKQDLNMADILVKQAEVSAGIQIQNFIKSRYPNLIVKFSEEGLQSDVWNNCVVEVSNKGKLNARNINLSFGGDVDVRDLQPIQELGINETKRIEFGVRPKAVGQVPMNVEVLYQRYFDESKYELKDLKNLRVEKPGTYLVEDVFLVHSDGRLITHHTRKFRESIDEDIFSGMLTVVQDFVKDSFKQRTKTGLKRLEFGESKILLEKSEHTYVACVTVGDEPDLLPLYMVEVLRQIEERYGKTLDGWSGMMQELEGVSEYVAKLIFVTDQKGASLGALESSPVTETVRILGSPTLLDEDAAEVEELLGHAKDQAALDPETAWQAINRARDEATKGVDKFKSKMKSLRDTTHQYVDEMREIGADVSQAEIIMRDADEAYEDGEFDRLQDIHLRIREGVERTKDAQVAKRIETDLTNLIQNIQSARTEGADVAMAESYLSRIQDALEEKNYRLVEDYFRRARESMDEGRKDALLKRCREALDRLTSTVVEAKQLGIGVEEAEGLLMRAADALRQERGQELEALLEAARSSVNQRVQDHLKDRYPRLFMTLPTGGLQEGLWNRYIVAVANKGNWPAKNIEIKMFGGFDVDGPKVMPFIGPNEKMTIDFGVKPGGTGTVPVDFQVFYHRPLDESRYELTESKEAKVESAGTYLVEDVILIHKDGRLIASESRTLRDQLSDEKMAKMLKTVQMFIKDVFVDKSGVGLNRMSFESAKILVEQAIDVNLGVTVLGEEPRLLPLYMVELLQMIQEKYGRQLAEWDGDSSKLEGIQEMLRSLLYVTQVAGADLGPLNASVVTAGARMVAKAGLSGKGEGDFLDMARAKIDTESFATVVELIKQMKEHAARPAEELTAEVKAAVLATKETIGLELSDEEVSAYVDALRQVLQAVHRAKQKAGMESYWPVKRVAVKPSAQLGIDAVTSFRKIIVNQSLAKELDIVPPNETWRGMNIRVQVDTDALNRAYKLWAKKIEILLKSQDAWKIKSGIDKGAYALGIEGQKVSIDREMVWFEETLPETVIEEPYDGGMVYVDTEMTEDILSEGYAKEIVRIIKDVRKDMKLKEEQGIQLQIKASKGLHKMLKNWREYISSQTKSADLRFVEQRPTDGYVVEATLGDESFALGVKLAEA
jgi:hypothetical protein